MDFFSLPVQSFVTGTIIYLFLHLTFSINRTSRAIQQNAAALAALEEALPSGMAHVMNEASKTSS